MRQIIHFIALLAIALLQSIDTSVECFTIKTQYLSKKNKSHFRLTKAVDSSVVLSASKTSSNGLDNSKEFGRRTILSTGTKAAAAFAYTSSGLIIPSYVANAESEADVTSTPQKVQIPTIKLGGNDCTLEVSRTIQGYWQLAGGHGKYNPDDAIRNMRAHFDSGITTLDTADIYGPSESIVGKFIKTQPNAIPCTKFCCFKFLDEIDKAEVRTRIEKACERLQVKKLPLVQFFWSNYNIKRYVDVALMLTELKEEGLIQEIGATNFDLPRLKELKNAGVPIVSHQVQLSAMDQRPVQSGMADWCKENDVSLIAFGTVGSGILSNQYLGTDAPTPEQKKTASMRMYSNTAARFGSWKLVQELLGTMDAIAKEIQESGRCEGVNISNVAQRYILETPAVASVLIGVRNQNHIEENARTHSFELTNAEKDAINAVVTKRNGPKGDVWDLERGTINN